MKVKKSRKKLIRATLVLSLFISFFQNINTAHADGNGLQWYWRSDSGATTGSTYGSGQLAEFTSGTCHSVTGDDINWAWASGGPGGSCPSDGFTSYGTGFLYAPWTGTFTFCDQSDDGFWLRIDSTNVIQDWDEQGAQTGQLCNLTNTIALTKGQIYTIKVFHHENGGGADMRLLWKYDAMSSYEIVPQKFLATTNNFAPSISISSVLPFYGRGNTTYNFGAPATGSACGSNQATACTYTITANNSMSPLTYTAVGTWPSILRVNSSSGTIEYNSSGTFTAGTYSNLQIRATDFYGTTYDSNAFSIGVTEPLVPTFGTYTRTADGFTVQISNYDAAFTWAGTATASGTVSISGSGLVTVSGVAAGTFSIATITTTRVGYDGGSAATASTQSLLAQSITWSPTTSVLVQQSPLTPSSTATVLGSASVSYSISNAGSTGCTINSSTAVISFIQPGSCVARATAAATSNYASATKDVTFTVGSISANPVSDTTTAGLTTSFSLTTIDTPSATTRTIKWQVASDTTTAAASVSWSDVSSGSGFTTPTFTTGTLTTTMNKYRYRAIVTFVSARGTSVETTTIATLTVNPTISITSTQTTISKKYGVAGVTRTVTFSGGTDTKTVSASATSLAGGKITFDNSTAIFSIDTGTVVGTYYDTITVTDAKGATASYTQVITSTVADTLTIQADTLTAISYGTTPTLTYTATGLVNGDSISSVTFGHISCANGGTCVVGDVGPGGGVVFYVSGASDSQTAVAGITNGGIYLEAAPPGWGNGISVQAGETIGTSYLDPVVNWCNTTNSTTGATQTSLGKGGINTSNIAANCTSGAGKIAADLTLNGKSDWYLPSYNELLEMSNQYNLISLNYGLNDCFTTTCYWTSTETGATSAYLYRFTNVPLYFSNYSKAISGTVKIRVRPIRAFSPLATGNETITAGAPTDAGTYQIKPTSITLANGVSTSNYAAVVYQSSPLTIYRVSQSPKLSMNNAQGSFDTGTATLQLLSAGGAGSGAVFYYVASGSASTCSISGSTLTIKSEGTCNIIGYKQASTNYFYDSTTVVSIVFTKFAAHLPVQIQLYPNMIPLNGANSLETTTATIPIINSITNSGGGAYIINGTGFTGVNRVVIGGTDVSITGSTATSINISGAGASFGPLFIECSDGRVGPVPFYIFTP